MSGSGPMKKSWQQICQDRHAKMLWSEIYVKWFEEKDYQVFLELADIGVSADNSRSKMDLMYKIVDLKGKRTPSLVFYYDSVIDEQVKHNFDAFCFDNQHEVLAVLACLNQIIDCKENFVQIEKLFDALWKNTGNQNSGFQYKDILRNMSKKYNIAQSDKIITLKGLKNNIEKESQKKTWHLEWEKKMLSCLSINKV